MTRILVPTDFSERSQEAVSYAVEYADSAGAEMLLLHVVEGEPIRSYAVGGQREALADRIDLTGNILRAQVPQKLIHRDLCEEAQWKLSAFLPAGFRNRFRTLVVVGKAVDEIIRVAREQEADLIMMATHGRRSLRHLLLGSVADKVIRKAPIPVITLDSTQLRLRQDSGLRSISYQRADAGNTICKGDEVAGVVHNPEEPERSTPVRACSAREARISPTSVT